MCLSGGSSSMGILASHERGFDHEESLRQSKCKSVERFPVSYPIVIYEEGGGAVDEFGSSITRRRTDAPVTSRLKSEGTALGLDVAPHDIPCHLLPIISKINCKPRHETTGKGRRQISNAIHRPSSCQVNETRGPTAATTKIPFPVESDGLLPVSVKTFKRAEPSHKQRHLVGGTEYSCELESLTIRTFPVASVVRSVGSVSDCAVTSDGKLAVCAHDDGKASVWDIADTRLVSLYVGHAEALNCIVLSHDDTLAFTGSNDCSIQVWNISSAMQDCELIGHEDWVYACAVTQDDQMLVSASADKTLRVWDVVTRQTLQLLTGHTSAVLCCEITADGSRVVSGSRDKTARVWDTLTGGALAVFQGHSDWVLCCALLPGDNQQQVATGSADSTLKLWNCDDASEVSTFVGHKTWVTSVLVAAADDSDDKTVSHTRLLSAAEDKTLRTWDVATAGFVDSVPLESVPTALSAPRIQRDYLSSVLATKGQDAFILRSSSVRKLRLSSSTSSLRSRSLDGMSSQTIMPRGYFSSWNSPPVAKSASPSFHDCSSVSLAETASDDFRSSIDEDIAHANNIMPKFPDEACPGYYRGLRIASAGKDESLQRNSWKPFKLSSLKKFPKLRFRESKPSHTCLY